MKKRLDILLVERGLAPSREKAKAIIMTGQVLVENQPEDKPGMSFDEKVNIRLKKNPLKYVSRGGYKLEKALKSFPIDLKDAVCMDIGASSGGFTDCMLQNGASKVYAVDVGYGQLNWRLRNDKRVVCMEKTNVRYLKPEEIGEKLDFVSIDVSFISLTKIIHVPYELLKDSGEIVCLIKPQFEVGKENVGKKGVVRDKKLHMEVIESISRFMLDTGFRIKGISYSPIKGPEGNIEFLIYMDKASSSIEEAELKELIKSTVDEAHESLNKSGGK